MIMRATLVGLLLLSVAACGGARGSASDASSAARQTQGTFTISAESRRFVTYRPANVPLRVGDRALVVMLHGCTQSVEDMARGTRMNSAAAEAGFVVLYPEQAAAAQVQKCWNWYLPEHSTRDRGEAGLLAALIDSVARAESIGAGRVALVGMSAGGAMAGNLVAAYPERYGALVVHSAIAALAASDLPSALAAMRGQVDGELLGARALAAMSPTVRGLPVLVLHGRDDKLVSEKNAVALVRQWSVVNARAGGGATVEQRLFDGVGHAWSGGAPEGSYTAPSGPNATAIIVDFLQRTGVVMKLSP